jgi:hypothetical protein
MEVPISPSMGGLCPAVLVLEHAVALRTPRRPKPAPAQLGGVLSKRSVRVDVEPEPVDGGGTMRRPAARLHRVLRIAEPELSGIVLCAETPALDQRRTTSNATRHLGPRGGHPFRIAMLPPAVVVHGAPTTLATGTVTPVDPAPAIRYPHAIVVALAPPSAVVRVGAPLDGTRTLLHVGTSMPASPRVVSAAPGALRSLHRTPVRHAAPRSGRRESRHGSQEQPLFAVAIWP